MNTSTDPLLSAEFCHSIIDQAPDSIIIMDSNWRVLKANEHALDQLGYTQQEFQRLDFFQIEETFTPQAAIQALELLDQAETPCFEGQIARKDGTFIDTETKVSRITDPTGSIYLLAFVRDISRNRQMEKALKSEKALMDALMDNIPDSIYFKDLDCRLIRVNQKLMHNYGVQREEELLGKNDIDIFGEEIGRKTMAVDREIIQTGQPKIGLVESRPLENGDLHWTLTTKVPLFDASGKITGLAGVSKEINTIKKAEEVLQLKEYQLSMASKIANLGYWEYDVIKDQYTFNDQFYEVFGTSAEEMGGYYMSAERFSELFLHPEDIGLIAREIQLAIDTRDPQFNRHLEHRFKYLNGETGYVSVNFFIEKDKEGRTVKSYGANQIITERKLAELAIKENESNLQKAFEIAAIGPYRYKIPSDQFEWSERAISVVGFSRDQVPQNLAGLLKKISQEDQESFLKAVKNRTVLGKLDIEVRINIRGNTKWLRFKSHKEYDRQNQPLVSVGVVQDITQQKSVETELINYREHLEELVQDRTVQLENINKDLEAFAYSISHDLRAPLRHINGFAHILKRKLSNTPDSVREYLGLIINSSKRMGTMIDGLLHFSRLGRQKITKSSVDLHKLVLEVVRSFQPDIRGRQLNWEIGKLPIIQGDPELLKIVFENLLSNAIKYTQTTPVARIEIHSLPVSEHNYCIAIKDNGIGFNMNYANKLFGVFQRLHNEEEFEGTGIGLAHAQQIVKKHGGFIQATAEPGKGATFYINL